MLSSASSVYLYLAILGSYISILVVIKILPYLVDMIIFFSSLIGAILVEDLYVDCCVYA